MIEHNGKMYARVTEILQPFNDFSKIDPAVLERKRIIGTNVHKAIDDYIKEDIPILCDEEMGYFRSYLKWAEYVNPLYSVNEKRFFDDTLMITGAIDAIVSIGESKDLVILDFKTSAVENHTTWPLQAHLYHYLAQKEFPSLSDRMIFLKLDKKGLVPVAYTYKFQQNTMNQCMQIVHEFMKARHTSST